MEKAASVESMHVCVCVCARALPPFYMRPDMIQIYIADA